MELLSAGLCDWAEEVSKCRFGPGKEGPYLPNVSESAIALVRGEVLFCLTCRQSLAGMLHAATKKTPQNDLIPLHVECFSWLLLSRNAPRCSLPEVAFRITTCRD